MKKYNVSGRGVLTLSFLFISLLCMGQKDRSELESQRKALESQIKSTTEILAKTQKSKTKTVNQLKTLNAQIRQRQELLESINEELKQVDQEAAQQEKSKEEAALAIHQLESRLDHALRAAYIRSQLEPSWIYLLSAQSIGQALSRWVYLRQYKSYISSQMKTLAQKKQKHQELIVQLEENKKAKKMLFNSEEEHKKEILAEQKSQQALVNNLGKEEKKLKTQLASTQEKKKKLDDEISRLISAEAKKMTSSGLSTAPETKALNDQFSANKGRLPWPVSKGLITDRFGTHPHPVLKGIVVQTNGIDIQAEEKASVKSLFAGTVASVTKIPGYDYMVMVRHGLYYTVYSKIASASVKKGDTVTTGQVLGYLGTEEPELHLEIWQDKTKLNPESWLAKK
ncbi:MAG: peptidoglycan DD-metalloendopeptidase family protein [Saprospiraceae bacterium]|nr:peptidoglycan DD-metalloendopeptidase family protein [Candidatus Opimibacter iunctus]